MPHGRDDGTEIYYAMDPSITNVEVPAAMDKCPQLILYG